MAGSSGSRRDKGPQQKGNLSLPGQSFVAAAKSYFVRMLIRKVQTSSENLTSPLDPH